MPVSTGNSHLDRILGGGIPRNRTILTTGGPGTGKSTLAMQFIQAGLAAGETGLYISTEQTVDEMRDSFAPFGFDLDHEDFTIASIHAEHGETIEDEDDIVLTSLEGESVFDAAFVPPFELRFVKKFLDRFGPVDRVVFDSISGLRPMTDDPDLFRRAVIELIRVFNDDFGATTILTAEHGVREPVLDAVQFSTHGVIEVWQDRIEGDYHKFLRVVKLRGVNHDTREFGIEFTSDGLQVISRQQPGQGEVELLGTGIPGFDALTGGGLVRGGTAVFGHDGRAELNALVLSVLYHRIAQGDTVVLIPPATMTPVRVDALLANYDVDLETLLSDDTMYVLDLHQVWAIEHDNVLVLDEDSTVRGLLETVDKERGQDPIIVVKNASTLLHATDESTARGLRYWIEGSLIRPDDVVCDIVNFRDLPETLVEFYIEASMQVFRTWLHDTGQQFLTLDKGPDGHLGMTRLVEFTNEVPFVRVQPPSSTGDS